MAATRDELLDAALAALNRHPTATTTEIAAAIGVSRATLHRHFSTREALIAEIAERSLDRWRRTQDEAGIDAAAASGDRAAIERALDALLRQFVADAEAFAVVLTEEYALTPAITERMEALIEREVDFYTAAQAAGVLRADLPARWLGDVVYGLLVSARETRRYGNVAPRDLPDLLVTTFLQGAAR